MINFIEGLQKDSAGSAKVAALVVGGVGAVWAASGAMGSVIKAVNRAYDRLETRPFWKVRGDGDRARAASSASRSSCSRC